MYLSCELTELVRSVDDWSCLEKRIAFLRRLDSLISTWEGRHHNLLDVFSHDQVESLLFDSIYYMDDEASCARGRRFIEFVARSSYKAAPPQLDAHDKPVLSKVTPIHLAAKQNQPRIAKSLFDIYDRFDANYSDEETGRTHLHVACIFGYIDVVKKFLELGQDPNVRVKETDDTPLHSLLRHGASPNLINVSKVTPLHTICKADQEADLLRLFFDICKKQRQPVQVDARDKNGNSALHLALRHSNRINLNDRIELLLRNGADPNVADKYGLTAFHVVCDIYRDAGLAEMFLRIGREQGKPVRIDARDKKGKTALHWALYNGHENVAELLLRNGAGPNVPDKYGETPLHVICGSYDEDEDDGLARLFFEVCDEMGRAVHIDARNVSGDTPLHFALNQGHGQMVELLLRRGADCTIANEEGSTPLHVAFQNELPEENFYATLFEINDEMGRTVSIDVVNRAGQTPLHLAAIYGTEALMQALLLKGADPRATDEEGETPLHIVCQGRSSAAASMLLDECRAEYRPVPLEPRAKRLGDAPLHRAAKHANRDAIEWLLRRGCDPNCVDNDGSTPLHIICQRQDDDDDLAKMFLEIEREVNDGRSTIRFEARDKWGWTPLQWAVANHLPNTVDALLTNGADLADFSFPTEIGFSRDFDERSSDWAKLELAAGAVACCELLEARGYELDREDAIKVMGFFDEYALFQPQLDEIWHNDDEFAVAAKQMTIKSDLSLHDFVVLPAREAARRVTSCKFFEFLRKPDRWLVPERYNEACLRHLREKISRRFFWGWGLDCFYELIHYRLPILCCEMIVENGSNEDLYNICKAVAGQS